MSELSVRPGDATPLRPDENVTSWQCRGTRHGRREDAAPGAEVDAIGRLHVRWVLAWVSGPGVRRELLGQAVEELDAAGARRFALVAPQIIGCRRQQFGHAVNRIDTSASIDLLVEPQHEARDRCRPAVARAKFLVERRFRLEGDLHGGRYLIFRTYRRGKLRKKLVEYVHGSLIHGDTGRQPRKYV